MSVHLQLIRRHNGVWGWVGRCQEWAASLDSLATIINCLSEVVHGSRPHAPISPTAIVLSLPAVAHLVSVLKIPALNPSEPPSHHQEK